MPATKTAKTLLASQAMAAAASVSATEWNLSAAYGGLVTVKLTNGASAPSVPPIVNFYVGEATGVKRLFYSASGDIVNSSVNEPMCQFPPEAMFCNVSIINGATNGITVEVYGQELTSL